MTDPAPDINNITIDRWDEIAFSQRGVQVDVLRLDKIHPEISGNKWFKLKYYLQRATREKKKTLVSFGGAHSNHILALATAAKMNGFHSLGKIRGEEPAHPSSILAMARTAGMELQFLSRSEYAAQTRMNSEALAKPPDTIQTLPLDANAVHIAETKSTNSTRTPTHHRLQSVADDVANDSALWIPEGGAGTEGIRGAAEILSEIDAGQYSHICLAMGTGTTLAGVINSAGHHQKVIGVSVLKGTKGLEPLHPSWVSDPARLASVQVMHDYHFGGYAKNTQILLDFMNHVYATSGIPTDFVYTGKLFYCVYQMVVEKAFSPGSRLLILHSGGLYGNRSLASGLLEY